LLKTADIFVQKFDKDLNFLDAKQFGTPHEDRGNSYLKDSILYIGGMTEGCMVGENHGSFDGFILKMNKNTLQFSNTTLATKNTAFENYFKIYPNPITSEFMIEKESEQNFDYIIYSTTGSILKQGILDAAQNIINVEGLSSNLYFMKCSNKEHSFVTKFVKQ
jgi:hypothetical protein